MRGPARPALLILLATLAVAGGCRTAPAKDGAAGVDAPAAADTGEEESTSTIWMFANQGLKPSLSQVLETWAVDEPDTPVRVEYLTSAQIAERLAGGDRPDLVLDGTKRIAPIVAYRASGTEDVAYGWDALEIAVRKGNPKAVADLRPFAAGDPVTTALCAAADPCGNAARSILESFQISAGPELTDAEPEKIAGEIAAGRVDAALLYRSDLHRFGAGALDGVAVPGSVRAASAFSLMTVKGTPEATRLTSFLATDVTADRVLRDAGLRPLVVDGDDPTAPGGDPTAEVP